MRNTYCNKLEYFRPVFYCDSQAKAKAKHHDANPSSNRSLKRKTWHANQAKKPSQKPTATVAPSGPVASAANAPVGAAAVAPPGPVASPAPAPGPVGDASGTRGCLAQIIISVFRFMTQHLMSIYTLNPKSPTTTLKHHERQATTGQPSMAEGAAMMRELGRLTAENSALRMVAPGRDFMRGYFFIRLPYLFLLGVCRMTQVPRANVSLFHALQDGTHTAIRDPVDSASHPFGNASGFMAPWLRSVLEVTWYYCGASIIC